MVRGLLLDEVEQRLFSAGLNDEGAAVLAAFSFNFFFFVNGTAHLCSEWKPTNLTSVFTVRTSVYRRLMVLR
jgi:hypothetical protein